MFARLAEITSDLAEKHYEYAEKLKEEASDFDASKIHKKRKEKRRKTAYRMKKIAGKVAGIMIGVAVAFSPVWVTAIALGLVC